MKIYLAATYGQMSEMRKAAEVIRSEGHEITSNWINGDEETQSKQDAALMDLADVGDADTLFAFSLPPKTFHTGGGRHVEFGYAYAKGKQIIIIGSKGEHIFHHLPGILHFSTLDEALKSL